MCKLEVCSRENIFGDNIAYAKMYDFSRGNMSQEDRINNITLVASICYQSSKAFGSESLFNRLKAESHGLPSSSFEFIPVLLSYDEFMEKGWSVVWTNKLKEGETEVKEGFQLDMERYGSWIEDGKYLLTNYRAVLMDQEKYGVDFTLRYNTEVECDIIKQHYKVFNFKVDFPTRSQMVRSRVNLQEISRRYVSAKRVEQEHYISGKMSKVVSKFTISKPFREAYDGNDDLTGFAGAPMGMLVENIEMSFTTQQVIDICMNHYFKSLEDGVKPEEARRIIPQTGYTQLWMGFLPYQLENFFKLRLDGHAQWEIRKCAEAMKDMIESEAA